MKHSLLITSLTLPFAYSKTSGELCQGTGERASDGNWYCSEVWAITYRNISQAGVYNRTTYVDPGTGTCGHETVGYGGTDPLTPLFGEVSMHLRGPMNVSQLAVYQLPNDMHTLQKRNTVPFYNRLRAPKKRETSITKPVWNTTLVNPSHRRVPRTTTCNSSPDPEADYTYEDSQSQATVHKRSMSVSTSSAEQADTAPGQDFVRRAAEDWNRVAYYTSASPAEATGLSFLANLGDPRESGTFDYAFGNSLSYVSSDGDVVAPESMPFNGTLATSEREIAVFSDKACDQDCPYWRPNATSHFGWSGSSKAFFIEFQMDHYENTGIDQGLISDAPAW